MDIDFRDKEGKSKMILIDSNIIIEIFQKDQKQLEAFCKKVKESGDIVFIAYQVLFEIAGPDCRDDEKASMRLKIIDFLREEIKLKFFPDLRFIIKKEIDDGGIIKRIPVHSDTAIDETFKDIREALKYLDNRSKIPNNGDKEGPDFSKKVIETNKNIYKDFKDNGYNFSKAKYFSFHFSFLEKFLYKKLIQLTLIENKEDDLLNKAHTIEEMEKLFEATITQKLLFDISKREKHIREKIAEQDFKENRLYSFLRAYTSICYYNVLSQEHINKVSHEKFARCIKNQNNDDLFLPLCVYSKVFITKDDKLKKRWDEKIKTRWDEKKIKIQTFEKFMDS